jgi:hypothetical protein
MRASKPEIAVRAAKFKFFRREAAAVLAFMRYARHFLCRNGSACAAFAACHRKRDAILSNDHPEIMQRG